MPKIEELSEQDLATVDTLINKLTNYDNPYLFRQRAIEELVSLFSIKGFSSVLWMNRFYSDIKSNERRGRVYSFIHVNDPPARLSYLWHLYVQRSSSIIEEAIFKTYPDEEVGFATLKELLSEETLKKNILGRLARMAGVVNIGYLWLKITDNDMWAFCLRKFKGEREFTKKDIALLKIIGVKILELRRIWWRERLNKTFSEREIEVFDLDCQGLEAQEIAEKLGIAVATVRTHLSKIHDKQKVPTRLLGEIDESFFNRKLPLTPHQSKILENVV